ncbi:MAG: acid phosphatase [Pseudomonadota bacterium]|nr:acid phosphatase [Pseudomonadota bacterium]
MKNPIKFSALLTPLAVAAVLTLSACGDSDTPTDTTTLLKNKVSNIVVIYAENRSFDNLYGNFPNANGLSTVVDSTGKVTSAYVPQVDRDGSALATLPPTWGGVMSPGSSVTVTENQSAGLANAPFDIATAYQPTAGVTITGDMVTRDLYHRFYENQMQIDGGKNDKFAAWADSGGLVMGHFDYSASPLYKLAQQYTLADNFFQGAFGGSFLNHQYLICACAPEYPNADTAAAHPTLNALQTNTDGSFTSNLVVSGTSPASVMNGKPVLKTGNIAPANYFGDGKFYAVNTMQPAFQPSGNAPVDLNGDDAKYANPAAGTTLPAQTRANIGDLLTAKSVGWKWYAGSWNAAVADGMQASTSPRTVIYAGNANGVATTAALDFQTHHQPFNFYADMDPVAHATDRANHLKDYTDLVSDAAAGTLPAVTFYKPEGLYNQHPGYANITNADQKIADLVAKLKASPQWKNMVIVITYDENGGQWDHVAPPKGDKLGPGTRIPALIISPYSKAGTVDHTQYDTASVLRLITRRFGLDVLPGLTQRDTALQANGAGVMGDLTNALDLTK